MKKLIYILLILLIANVSTAGNLIIKKVSTGVSCLSGAYAFHWDGDYDTTLTACVDDGSSTIIGLQTNGDLGIPYGESGSNGFLMNAVDDYIEFTDSTCATTCTMFVRFKVETVNTPDGEYVYVTGPSSSDNDTLIGVRLKSNGALYGLLVTNGVVYSTTSSSYTRGNWNTIGVTWRVDAGDDLCFCRDADCDIPTWTCSNTGVAIWGTAPVRIRIGEPETWWTAVIDDNCYTDKVLIIDSWQASTINGW